jgi:hypothetical protein
MALNLNHLPINDRGEVWHEGQLVGQMPQAGVGAGRDAIAQSVMAQQGMPPPPLLQAPQMQPQGGGNRTQIGQGWSTEGNNVFDPGGNIVGRHGLQQYGAIPGVTSQVRGGNGDPFNQFARPVGSSLSGGMPGAVNDPDMSGFDSGVLADPGAQGPVTGPGALGFHGGGGMRDVFDPGYETPASPPTGQVPDPEDMDFNTMGEREASLSTPSLSTPSFDVGAMSGAGGFGGFGGGDFGGFGGFDAGGMGTDTAGGVG